MTARAFKHLARRLTRSSLAEQAVVTMDGVAHTTRGILMRLEAAADVENQKFTNVEIKIALAVANLPRRPRAGDRIVLDGVAYLIQAGTENTGAGMVHCPVIETT